MPSMSSARPKKCSFSQYDQLRREYNGDEKVPSIRLSPLKSLELEHVLSLSPAKNDDGLKLFPTIPVPEMLGKQGKSETRASLTLFRQKSRYD